MRSRISFAFQPIVDIFSGKAAFYEALMRPMGDEFTSPFQVLEIARTQAKLYQIEKMTYFGVFRSIQEKAGLLGGRRVFLNSIPNQRLSDRDFSTLIDLYPSTFRQVVVEITEGELRDHALLEKKLERVRAHGGEIAVDDFGAGHSGDLTKLGFTPEYIKIDTSVVAEVEKHAFKQRLIDTVMDYAAPHGIKVIAEGVETQGETECLIRLGVDYLQGHYLARPTEELIEISPEVSEQLREISARYRDRRGGLGTRT